MIMTVAQEIQNRQFKLASRGIRQNFPVRMVICGDPNSQFIGIDANGDWGTLLANLMTQHPRMMLVVAQACMRALSAALSIPLEEPEPPNGSGDADVDPEPE